MLEAAQGGVLDRGGLWIPRVDLHHVIEAVWLVGFLANIPAVLEALPLAGGFCILDAVALEALASRLILDLFATGEVLIHIFFTGKDGSPWGHTAGAVVKRALNDFSFGVLGGLDQVVTNDGSAQFEGGVAVDAAVVLAHHWLEATVLVVTLNLDHGESVVGHFDHDLFFGGVFRIVATEHLLRGGVFVIGNQQEVVLLTFDGQQGCEVVVEAVLALGIFHVLVVHGPLARALYDLVAPADDNIVGVSLGNRNCIFGVGCDHLEVQALWGGNIRSSAGGTGCFGGVGVEPVAVIRACGDEGRATHGDHSGATGAEGGAAGECALHEVAEVGVIGRVGDWLAAGVAALVDACPVGTARTEIHFSQQITALETH